MLAFQTLVTDNKIMCSCDATSTASFFTDLIDFGVEP
jgi:hypothetical protein